MNLTRPLRIQYRICVSSLQWLFGRYPLVDNAFSYQRYLRPVLIGALWLVAIEGVIVDALLVAIFGNSGWVWLGLGLNVYALMWIAGVLGSLRTLPHVVDSDRVILRDSVFHEVTIPMTAIRSIQRIHVPAKPRTGYRLDPATKTLLLAHGNANIKITLDDPDSGLAVVKATADDPALFVSSVKTSAAIS